MTAIIAQYKLYIDLHIYTPREKETERFLKKKKEKYNFLISFLMF